MRQLQVAQNEQRRLSMEALNVSWWWQYARQHVFWFEFTKWQSGRWSTGFISSSLKAKQEFESMEYERQEQVWALVEDDVRLTVSSCPLCEAAELAKSTWRCLEKWSALIMVCWLNKLPCYRVELTARLQNEKTALQTELEARRLVCHFDFHTTGPFLLEILTRSWTRTIRSSFKTRPWAYFGLVKHDARLGWFWTDFYIPNFLGMERGLITTPIMVLSKGPATPTSRSDRDSTRLWTFAMEICSGCVLLTKFTVWDFFFETKRLAMCSRCRAPCQEAW